MSEPTQYLRFGRAGTVVDLRVDVLEDGDIVRLHSEGTDLPFNVSGVDLVEALEELRNLIEPDGWLLFCNACRRNAVHSGMSRDMSRGFRHYLVKVGKHAAPDEIVDALELVDIAEASEIVTVSEQKMFHDRWLAWLPRYTE